MKNIRFLVRNGRGVQRYIIFPNIKLSETRIILILIKKIKSEVCTLGLSSSMHAVLVILFKYTINSYKVRLDLYFSA